jgi:hypothetical protein
LIGNCEEGIMSRKRSKRSKARRHGKKSRDMPFGKMAMFGGLAVGAYLLWKRASAAKVTA